MKLKWIKYNDNGKHQPTAFYAVLPYGKNFIRIWVQGNTFYIDEASEVCDDGTVRIEHILNRSKEHYTGDAYSKKEVIKLAEQEFKNKYPLYGTKMERLIHK
jgi:hypothetical protein